MFSALSGRYVVNLFQTAKDNAGYVLFVVSAVVLLKMADHAMKKPTAKQCSSGPRGCKKGVLGRGTIPHLSPNNGEQSSFGPAHLCVQSRGAAPVYCALAYATQDVDYRATGVYIRVGVATPAAYGHSPR